ncbi:MAG: UDP-2,3-diacylglucosamine pyrophosphatase LpxG [Chlamydiales bacterium]|nr:UDP-2,3-diacylglucosamine pyrophosphatase LpxG [Chlamydiales bacterium]MCH9619353.1 UDP-2,3-diacylglucosamine pyrophosphatase LpxG [Chlamydiales bacterium]MCH9622157.1 UDP-2,3-diacylglucosamine pyrophosphatase LpxG [Chlamydiales bacterium]
MSLAFDLISICSIIGIWPRYIEPSILKTTRLDWPLEKNERHLNGLTVVQISDLHFNRATSERFLNKIVRRTMRQKPDLILFTGDFICHSRLEDGERLKTFLCKLQAPLGCYCTLGNHDYNQYISLSREGIYDVVSRPNPLNAICHGIRILFSKQSIQYKVSDKARSCLPSPPLLELLDKTPFTLLENATITLPIGLNITGLGEYSTARCRPKTAFAGFDKRYPGIALSHNPDTFEELSTYPAKWTLCGHTHGEQIHLPFCRFLSRKLARLQYPNYTRGLFEKENKKLYVSRGVGAPKPFRFCSPPEIVVIKGVEK